MFFQSASSSEIFEKDAISTLEYRFLITLRSLTKLGLNSRTVMEKLGSSRTGKNGLNGSIKVIIIFMTFCLKHAVSLTFYFPNLRKSFFSLKLCTPYSNLVNYTFVNN